MRREPSGGASGGAISKATAGAAVVAARKQPPPSVGQVLAGLHPAPSTTEKGIRVAQQIEQANDDYFGKPLPTLDQQSSSAAGAGRMTAGDVRSALTAATTSAPPHLCRAVLAATITQQRWMAGPVDPAGVMLDLSDRNLLCLDVQGGLAVAGSADHGLVLCDISKGRKVRSLYTKTAGHSEWVTTCKFTPDGRVLSGGMDSKLCLWAANAPRCDDLMGHTGSISDVVVNEHNYAVSAAYDRTLRVWDLSGRTCTGLLSAHSQPVMQVAWKHSTLVSGDRRGQIHCWDPSVGRSVTALATKGGQIGALNIFADSQAGLVCAGDQTGTLSIWDFARSGATPIMQKTLHAGGVLCDIQQSAPTTLQNSMLVTAGADRKINVLDVRHNLKPLFTFSEHRDFIYSLACAGPSLVLSGGGDGSLLVHDISGQGKCLYGIGASTAAVRAIGVASGAAAAGAGAARSGARAGAGAGGDKLVVAGDDGKLAIFDF